MRLTCLPKASFRRVTLVLLLTSALLWTAAVVTFTAFPFHGRRSLKQAWDLHWSGNLSFPWQDASSGPRVQEAGAYRRYSPTSRSGGVAGNATSITSKAGTSTAHVLVPRTLVPGQKVPFITAPVSGKLGNRMFQYAALLGVARMNGMEPFYKPHCNLQAYFGVTHVRDGDSSHFSVVNENNFASYDPKFERLPLNNTTIVQYFQSWKYFDFMRDTIRKEFTFKDNVKAAAAGLLGKHSQALGNKTKVGMHVRRGDMLLKYHVRKGYHVAPRSYLVKAMDWMRQKHGDVVFVVVSDDLSWCQKELPDVNRVLVSMAGAEVHLAVLASCDHVIMTVGTYGWWGGYLAGGDVVYYWDSQQLLHSPPLPVEITRPQDLYPPHWTALTG